MTYWADTNQSTVTPGQIGRSSLARLPFTFTGTSITITIDVTSNYTIDASGQEIGVYVDGVYNTRFAVGNQGGAKRRMSATISGLSNALHTIELHDGAQQKSPSLASPTLRGTWVLSVAANVAIAPTVYVPPSRRVLLYGDSISIGLVSVTPTQFAAIEQLRTAGYRVTSWGHGSHALRDDVTDAASAAAFATHLSRMLDGTLRNDLWIQIAFNDFYGTGGGGFWSASSYGAALSLLLDAVHAIRPSVNVYLQRPILWGTEAAANSFSNTLAAYRTAMDSAGSGRSYVTMVDGSTWSPLTLGDGIHPDTASQATIKTAMAAVLL